MATKKKKTTSRSKRTTGKKTAARKKTTGKKTARRSTAARSTSRKKTKSGKAGSAKKSSGKKSVKKKSSKKAAGKSSAGAAKKKTKTKKKAKTKTTSKKSAAKTKKKTSRKPAAKKTSSKSTKKSGSKKTAVKAETSEKSAKGSAKGKNKRSQSVAEAASGAAADKQGYVFINGRRVRMISTQGKGITRKSRKVRAEAVEQEQPAEIKPGKSKLSKKELRHYRDLLLIKRAELVGDLTALEAEALRSSGGNISHMPIHMADIGSDTYEQDFMLGMAEAERKQIREIDDALMRIKDGTYGVCQMTGKPIPKARLDAKPWAKYTIEAARKMEGHWQS